MCLFLSILKAYMLDSKIPPGDLELKWSKFKDSAGLVSPANRRKFKIIVVGTGLAGASAAASLGEQGYNVKVFTYHDTSRRAHSVAAQGGINAAKNYKNDGDSVWRLFRDTIKGGDFRAREANVFRLAEISSSIIDACVALGVPFAREYGGTLETRSFGGTQVSRTFYAKGQTGQQLLLACYSALLRQVELGTVELFTWKEMVDLVVKEGRAVGIIVRDLISGKLDQVAADAVILATGGYSNVYFLSTNARKSNCTAIIRAFRRGALFANPCFTQIHPTSIPASSDHQSKLTLMSESLRNDGRVWAPRRKDLVGRDPRDIPESDRHYFLEEMYPSYGNLAPRDIASRAVKRICDQGLGVGPTGHGVYLDFRDALKRFGKDVIESKYGNLFEMYYLITGENPYERPMRIYPAPHYTMGGLWVDYTLMSNLEGLFVIGEANFSDHGANRLGASALMQGLADGFFIIPVVVPDFLAKKGKANVSEDDACFAESKANVELLLKKLAEATGSVPVLEFHRRLGKILWDYAGMERSREGLEFALKQVREMKEKFFQIILPPKASDGTAFGDFEDAYRLYDFIELGELMIIDALHRGESCGGHFRVEYQTPDGEASRNDEKFSHVACWKRESDGYSMVKEPLVYEFIKPTERSYK